MFKKLLNHAVIAVITVLTICSISSCSKDDDVSSNDIVGDWQMIHTKGWEKENGRIVDQWEEYDSYYTLKFKKGGSVQIIEDDEVEWGAYSLNNGELIMMFGDEVENWGKCSITNDRMILTRYEKYTYGGRSYEEYEEDTYIRIN